jgi:Spy/CpxP family protein refolding chaperone
MMDPAQMVQRLDQALELTDDQKAKITDISKKQAEQMQALRDEMRAKMQDLEKARHDQIRALLTADQQKKFDAMPPPGRVVTDVVAAARVDPAATRHLHLLRPRHLRREDPLG